VRHGAEPTASAAGPDVGSHGGQDARQRQHTSDQSPTRPPTARCCSGSSSTRSGPPWRGRRDPRDSAGFVEAEQSPGPSDDRDRRGRRLARHRHRTVGPRRRCCATWARRSARPASSPCWACSRSPWCGSPRCRCRRARHEEIPRLLGWLMLAAVFGGPAASSQIPTHGDLIRARRPGKPCPEALMNPLARAVRRRRRRGSADPGSPGCRTRTSSRRRSMTPRPW